MTGCTCDNKRCDSGIIPMEDAAFLIVSCMENNHVMKLSMAGDPDATAEKLKAFRESNEPYETMLTPLACEGAADELKDELEGDWSPPYDFSDVDDVPQ